MNADDIACLRITLDNIDPVILRRIKVPLTIRLDRLHLTVQAAMGWTNSHLYEIKAGKNSWSDPSPEWGGDGPLNARKFTLLDALEKSRKKTFKYTYDFGDDWEHTIQIEYVKRPVAGVEYYPHLIEAAGQCPPEDVGGPSVYAEFVEARSDPNHARHADFDDCFEGDFDPNEVDTDRIAKDLAVLAKRWSRKPGSRRKRSA
jgi:hypothetical protein